MRFEPLAVYSNCRPRLLVPLLKVKLNRWIEGSKRKINERVLWVKIGSRHLKEHILSSELSEKSTGGVSTTQKLTRCFFTHSLCLSALSGALFCCCCGQWQIRKEMKQDRRYQVLLDCFLILTLFPSISKGVRPSTFSRPKASKKCQYYFCTCLNLLKNGN